MCDDCSTPVDVAVTKRPYVILPDVGGDAAVYEMLVAAGANKCEWTPVQSDRFTAYYLPEGWTVTPARLQYKRRKAAAVQQIGKEAEIVDEFACPRAFVQLTIDQTGAHGIAVVMSPTRLRIVLRFTRKHVSHPVAAMIALTFGVTVPLIRGLIFTRS